MSQLSSISVIRATWARQARTSVDVQGRRCVTRQLQMRAVERQVTLSVAF